MSLRRADHRDWAMIRPAEDLALYRADMARWEHAERGDLPGWRPSLRDWVRGR